jgi:hypothetical protein
MFIPTHLFISKEGKDISVKLLQENRNLIFTCRDDFDPNTIVEFDLNKKASNKNYNLFQIKFNNNRVYIPIDRMDEMYKLFGRIKIKKVIELIDEEIIDMI